MGDLPQAVKVQDVMTGAIAAVVCLVLAALASWHVWMAFLPAGRGSAAVPSVDGNPLFVPSRRTTLAVAAALLLFAGLVAATAGLVGVGLSPVVLSWASYALALGFLARAVGEFRYVGFFKRVRGSRFARLDSSLYSPLCLALAIAVAWVASHHAA